MTDLVITLATEAPQGGGLTPEASSRSALQLLQVSVVALALVLVLVALLVVLAVLRRTRPSRRRADRRPSAPADAWGEAGRRAEPETRQFTVDERGELVERHGDGSPVEARAAGLAITGRRPVALVTGSVRRVGFAIADALAGRGCDVVITHRGSDAEAERAADELSRRGVSVHAVKLDLSDIAGVQATARKLAADLPRLDVLVHNASVYRRTPLEAMQAADAEEAWRVHALGPLLLTQALAGLLRASPLPGGGAVVAMLDVHALGLPRAGYSAYAMSKAALGEMVRSLARELAPRVRVNGVAPGVVAWPETGEEASPPAQRAYLERVPLGRAGTPEEAAEAVRWLALDAAYVTGQIVRVDGGRSLL